MVTLNLFGVGITADGSMIVIALPHRLTRPLAKADALNLAAYIVALADPSFDTEQYPKTEFGLTLETIKGA